MVVFFVFTGHKLDKDMEQMLRRLGALKNTFKSHCTAFAENAALLAES